MRTVTISSRAISLLCQLAVALTVVSSAVAQDAPFQSRQVTPAGEYTHGIEGPAVDQQGNLYVVNFGKPGTIGKLAAGASQSELFAVLPEGSVGNAIRFDREGRMFVADYKKHTIFVVGRDGKDVETYFHSDDFNQPNDMTVATDGTIYASDPNWKRHDGQIWRVQRSADGNVIGEKMTADRRMSTTNGIDLSPDGKTLYVGESDTREIWSYRIDGTRLVAPKLVKRFDDFDIDGLRTDTAGNLFAARILKGTIAVLTPGGKLIREIPLNGKEPTNLAFGGNDGKTVFVTQRQGGFVESFRTDRPGREYCFWACPGRK
ncbi:SMP-30/gluconolactonase/LRE family protein [Bradyrhizobium erythrophlei]|jgi:signal peptidase|uniref:SMP-30/gluconolactonase/LRE family protein n=1 Tax=Bradyrhizobium erythrophlei TaxID=1437360 RepID=UPI0009A73FB4|nr:SMP-30/gluconolactonase/LRE family protein [Bradyrhizobium erythrophlei]